MAGVDEHALELRRTFVGLDDSDRALLEPLIPWIKLVSGGLAERFYDFQFSFGPTKQFFADHARNTNRSLAELRRGLEEAQARYIETVFEGAATSWDLDYFEQRLHVGLVHDRINLPFKWYIGSYCLWRKLIRGALAQRRLDEHGAGPAPGGPEAGSCADTDGAIDDVMQSVDKVFNLDLQAIGDAFLMATLESLGLDIASVTPRPGQDRTEGIAQLKDEIQSVAQALPELTSSIGSVAASIDELSIASREISARSSEVFSMSEQAATLAETASGAVQRLSESSERIGGVTNAIAKVGGSDESPRAQREHRGSPSRGGRRRLRGCLA